MNPCISLQASPVCFPGKKDKTQGGSGLAWVTQQVRGEPRQGPTAALVATQRTSLLLALPSLALKNGQQGMDWAVTALREAEYWVPPSEHSATPMPPRAGTQSAAAPVPSWSAEAGNPSHVPGSGNGDGVNTDEAVPTGPKPGPSRCPLLGKGRWCECQGQGQRALGAFEDLRRGGSQPRL